MTTQTSHLPFDLSVAMNHLSAKDEKLAELITSTLPFQMDADPLQSPYEALLEAIAYQSISGKAAATIYGRIKALSATGRAPTPQEMLKLRKPVLRKGANADPYHWCGRTHNYRFGTCWRPGTSPYHGAARLFPHDKTCLGFQLPVDRHFFWRANPRHLVLVYRSGDRAARALSAG